MQAKKRYAAFAVFLDQFLYRLAKTDRGGYCPGESIAISMEIENHSSRRINCVLASLKQKVVYYAKGHSHVDEMVI